MPRTSCKWQGCTYEYSGPESLHQHEAMPHTRCVCGRYTLAAGLKEHQRSCSVYQHDRDQQRSRCAGCESEILEGQHYLLIPALVFQTRMPADYVPVREIPDTEIKDIVLCTPGCLTDFARRDELLQDVFGDWIESLREYEMIVEGGHYWYSLRNAANALNSSWAKVDFGDSVRETDGTYREMTEGDRRRVAGVARDIRASK